MSIIQWHKITSSVLCFHVAGFLFLRQRFRRRQLRLELSATAPQSITTGEMAMRLLLVGGHPHLSLP
jgi:hypothetical protein